MTNEVKTVTVVTTYSNYKQYPIQFNWKESKADELIKQLHAVLVKAAADQKETPTVKQLIYHTTSTLDSEFRHFTAMRSAAMTLIPNADEIEYLLSYRKSAPSSRPSVLML